MGYLRVATVGAVLAASVAAGCGSSDDSSTSSTATNAAAPTSTAATTSADKPVNVAWITYFFADYQQAEEQGLKQGLASNGGSVKLFNANFDPSKLQQQCQDAISSGRYDALVVSPVTPPTGVPCATAAKAAGIPVIAMEGVIGPDPDKLEPQVAGVVGTVATAPTPSARDMIELVKQACAGTDPCQTIVDTSPTDPFGSLVLKQLKTMAGIDVVQTINSNYDPAQMQKIAPDVFAAHPDTDVLVTLSDQQALAAVPAAKAAGLAGKIKLLGAGGSRQGAQAVKDGTMFGTLGTWPVQTGEIAAKMAVQAVNGQPVDPSAVDGQTIDKPEFITKATVDQFKPEWGAQSS